MIYCQFQMLIIDYSLDMFRASLCPSSGERPLFTTYGVYLLVVLDVTGFGTVVLRWGCDHCEPSQWSHPQRSTTVPKPATSNTTSKYTTVWLGEHWTFIVEGFIKNGGSLVATQRAFRIRFALGRREAVSDKKTIYLWVSNFRQTGQTL